MTVTPWRQRTTLTMSTMWSALYQRPTDLALRGDVKSLRELELVGAGAAHSAVFVEEGAIISSLDFSKRVRTTGVLSGANAGRSSSTRMLRGPRSISRDSHLRIFMPSSFGRPHAHSFQSDINHSEIGIGVTSGDCVAYRCGRFLR